jgi:tetraacyldisaccharide 4'-kinase
VRLRNWRFDRTHGTVNVGVPIISVGNITTGGTGKTPVVAWIVDRLREFGRQPAILSRGYKPIDGAANDEKRLLDRLCPGVPHIQDPDRVAGAQLAIAGHGCDVLVLDDGFQHRRLARNLDVVLIDALNPWGYGHLLPRGLLREPPSALRRASIVVVTRTDACPADALCRVQREISQQTAAAVVTSAFRPVALVDAAEATAPLTAIDGETILAFCGIGNPEGFWRTLSVIGPDLFHVQRLVFPDHHHYQLADLLRIADAARNRSANW